MKRTPEMGSGVNTPPAELMEKIEGNFYPSKIKVHG